MIAPTKHIPVSQSLLGVGGALLVALETEKTTNALWEVVRSEVFTFERFILGLDLLFILGLVELHDGMLRKVKP